MLLEDLVVMRVTFRSVMKENGVGCVIPTGAHQKLKLFEDKLDILLHVCFLEKKLCILFTI